MKKLITANFLLFAIFTFSANGQDFSSTLTVGGGENPLITVPIPVTLEFGNTINNVVGKTDVDLDQMALLLNGYMGNGYIQNLAFDGTNTFTYEIVPLIDGPVSIAIIETFVYDESGNTNESIWDVFEYDAGAGEVFTFVGGIPNAIATLNAADGDGSTDWLRNIRDIEVNASDEVFLTDLTHHKVLSTNNGSLTTYAGADTEDDDGGFVDDDLLLAEFYGPGDLAIDASGNIYVADQGNYRIRKLSGGEVTTVAGDGTAGTDVGDALTSSINVGKLAIGSGGDFYFTNNARTIIYKLESGTISQVVDFGTAKVNDLKVDTNGDLVFSSNSGLYTYDISEAELGSLLTGYQVTDVELTSTGEIYFMLKGNADNLETFFEPGVMNLYKLNSEQTEFSFILAFDRLFYVEILNLSPNLLLTHISDYYQGNKGMIDLASDDKLYVNFAQNVWSVDLVEAVVDDPPTLDEALTDFRIFESRVPLTIDLTNVATDEDNIDANITYSVSSNTNSSLVSTSVDGSELTLSFTSDAIGTAEITLTATSNELTVDNIFTVTVEEESRLLYSQQGTFEGSVASQILPDYGNKVLEIVEEFSVDEGESWYIDAISVVGNTTGSFSEARFTIYENDGGSVGDLIFESQIMDTETHDFTGDNGVQNGNFRLLLQEGTELSEGDYWLSVQTNQVYGGGGGFWRWGYSTPATGLDVLARDPGNLLGGAYPSDYASMELDASMIFGIHGSNTNEVEWIGNVDSDWGTAGNWSGNAVPQSTDDVLIPDVSEASGNFPVIAGNFAVEDIEIQTEAELIISSGASLAIMGVVHGGGSATVQRELVGGDGTKNSGGYNIIGSPMRDATIGSLGSPNLVYVYDGTEYVNLTTSTAIGLAPGAGVFIAYDEPDPIVEISGTLNSGDISFGLGGSSEFYLVANPYAAAIDRTAFLAENGSDIIDGALYFWDDGGSNDGEVRSGVYVTVDAAGNATNGSFDGNIRSTQGFFVYSGTDPEPVVTFTPSMQVTSTDANSDAGFHRLANENQLIRLRLSDGINQDEILINLSEAGTQGFDTGLDVRKLMNPEISFFSNLEDKNLAIQALPNESADINLGFETNTSDLHTITLLQNASNASLTLVDKVTGTTYDLNGQNQAQIMITASDSNRFTLQLRKPEVLGSTKQFTKLRVWGHPEGLTIAHDQKSGEGHVSIHAMEGKLIYEKHVVFEEGKVFIQPDLKSNMLYLLQVDGKSIKFMVK